MEKLADAASSQAAVATGPSETEMFLKMQELKKLYKTYQRELGIPVVIEEPASDEDLQQDEEEYINIGLFSGEIMFKVSVDSSDEEAENEEATEKIRNIPPNAAPSYSPNLTLAELQELVKMVIIRNGSSCHIETIVENVKMKWQREGRLKRDGSYFGHADSKRAVQNTLRTKLDGRALFSRDNNFEGCWVINWPEKAKKTAYQPLYALLQDCINLNGGLSFLEEIYQYVKEVWSHENIDPPMPADELELLIRITLSTNPNITEDSSMPEHYQTLKKKRKAPASGKKDFLLDLPPEKRSKLLNLKKKLKHDGNHQTEKKIDQSCPICGKEYVYKRNASMSDDENNWIRCDDCHKWVMVKCDNIQNINLYDDANPNHLHYSCPHCRGRTIGIFPQVKSNTTKHSDSKKGDKSPPSTIVSWEEEELKSSTLEELEQKILSRIAKDFDSSYIEMEVIKQRLLDTQNIFQDEIQKQAILLKSRRERETSEVKSAFERKIQKLKELQQQKLHEIEKELGLELQAFYKQQKEEHNNVKNRLLTFVGPRC